MRIGVDFDNTIVCFDPLFYFAAQSRSLVPSNVPATKLAIRDYLRSQGQEDAWTELQGFVYGNLIREAQAYPGVQEFVERAIKEKNDVYIISHKTEKPAKGPEYNLHEAAQSWLKQHGFFSRLNLDPQNVFFEVSIPAKLNRIQNERCQIFVDDLLEFLTNPAFPKNVQRIHFAPAGPKASLPFPQVSSWTEIQHFLF